MSTLSLRWESAQRWTGTDAWGNEVSIDGDRESGTGSKPSDLVPISLAACIGYTLVQILEKKRLTFTSIETTIEVEQDREPPWAFSAINCHYVITGDVDQAVAKKALDLAHEKYCAVSASLPNTTMEHSVEIRPS